MFRNLIVILICIGFVVVAESSVIAKPPADNENCDAERCGKLVEEIAKLENEKFFLTTQLKLTKYGCLLYLITILSLLYSNFFESCL